MRRGQHFPLEGVFGGHRIAIQWAGARGAGPLAVCRTVSAWRTVPCPALIFNVPKTFM